MRHHWRLVPLVCVVQHEHLSKPQNSSSRGPLPLHSIDVVLISLVWLVRAVNRFRVHTLESALTCFMTLQDSCQRFHHIRYESNRDIRALGWINHLTMYQYQLGAMHKRHTTHWSLPQLQRLCLPDAAS